MSDDENVAGLNKQVSNLVFYAQSTIMVISGCYTFCRYAVSVKNMSMLKTHTYSD